MLCQQVRSVAALRAALLVLTLSCWVGAAQIGRAQPAIHPQPLGLAAGDPTTVKLSPEQQKQIGLQTTVLIVEPHPEQFRAYGAVLDIARVTELTNSYANAYAQLQMAQARFDVAKSAFERAKNLAQSAALPRKDAEAAEGTFRTEQAALSAAESQVRTLGATAQQEWGPLIGGAIIERSPTVVRLIERERFLVQVTLQPGATLAAPPRTALAQAPTRDANIDLQYLSPATRTDARIQGVSYFFTAQGDSGLLPGITRRSMCRLARHTRGYSSRTQPSCAGRGAPGCTCASAPRRSSGTRSTPTNRSPTTITSCGTFPSARKS